jgi:signal transduction histidine kinase
MKARQSSLSLAEEALEELLKRHQSEEAVGELEIQLDLREKFFSLVAHDLRTPLMTARLSAKMAQANIKDDPALCSKHIQRILRALERADRLIRDLLDANRLRAGLSILIQRELCDLGEVVEKCVDELSPIHGGRCHCSRLEKLPGPFDPAAIRRALENLVWNAIKYGAESSPITVSLRSGDAKALLSVRNEGAVLSPDKLASFFQWHKRSTTAEEDPAEGWGLGLMLVKGIAEAHGGQVMAESSAKAGTVFTLELPLGRMTSD